MTLHQYFLIAMAVLMFVVVPIFGVASFVRWLNTKPSERPEQRGGGGGLTGALMMGVDKLIRPSAEHRIEAENPIVKEDEQDGE